MTKKAAGNNGSHRWVASVKTDSTHPPEGLFNKDAATITRSLASKKVSPKGATSGLRMLTYFINRAGKGLTEEHRSTLERAKEMLSKRIKRDRERTTRK
jgi:tRNA(adenine34) deaminase